MNQRVMDRVHRLDATTPGGPGSTAYSNSDCGIFCRSDLWSDPPDLEGLGFDVVGILGNDGLIARLRCRSASMYICSRSVSPGLCFWRIGGELESTRRMQLLVGHRHAPIGDAAVRIEHDGLAERSLGLDEPEAVQLTDPLVDEFLDVRPLSMETGKWTLPVPPMR